MGFGRDLRCCVSFICSAIGERVASNGSGTVEVTVSPRRKNVMRMVGRRLRRSFPGYDFRLSTSVCGKLSLVSWNERKAA